jgi:hypothetical protein
VQFHPEAVLTECGPELLGNFLRLAGLVNGRETNWRDVALVGIAGQSWPELPITF